MVGPWHNLYCVTAWRLEEESDLLVFTQSVCSVGFGGYEMVKSDPAELLRNVNGLV